MGWRCFLILLVVWTTKIEGKDILPNLQTPAPFPAKDLGIPPKEVEKAFVIAEQRLQDRKNYESNMAQYGAIIPKGSMSAEARHQRFTATDPKAVQNDNIEELYLEASDVLATKYNLGPDDIRYGLPNVAIPSDPRRTPSSLSAQQSCQKAFAPSTCDRNAKYRTADGSCNNLQNPNWGKSFTCFERLLPAAYANSLDAPRASVNGGELPNPRLISTTLHPDVDVRANAYTLMTFQWGQFMDHDITLTPMTRAGTTMDMIECCLANGQPTHPACYQINLPRNDYFFSPRRQTCLNFVRSAGCPQNCQLGPRGQTNQLTAFIDASNVYGSDDNETSSLRLFSGGFLKFQTNQGEVLLPPSIDPVNDQCSRQEGQGSCFHAGDERVNEQPALTSMHTMWLRQHNRIAQAIGDNYPRASDEAIFQISRKIVGAQLQAITYGQFLPVVLGPNYMNYFNLGLSNGYTTYDPNTQPTVVHEFSTCAYRFGHTLIPNILPKVDQNYNYQPQSSLNLSENFFFPFSLFNGDLPQIVRGLLSTAALQFDRFIVSSVTNNLYKQRGTAFGMDLPALNVQRGRDHGVHGYVDYVNYCFGITIQSFNDANYQYFMTRDNWVRLSRVYSDVRDIDLFTAGVLETPLDGGVVGPTFGCIIGIQFYHLKFGDRFYFEHGNLVNSFTLAQINEIRNTKLARVICWNAGIPQIPENVFLPFNYGDLEYCQNLFDMDITKFKP